MDRASAASLRVALTDEPACPLESGFLQTQNLDFLNFL